MVRHHLAMFGAHWSSASRDITYLICHLTLQDSVIEESCDVIGRSSSSPSHVW